MTRIRAIVRKELREYRRNRQILASMVIFPAVFLAAVELFAAPATASAFARGPVLLAQLVFTPLVATWSIWVGIAVSSR